MSINDQLAEQTAAEGGQPIDPSIPHFAVEDKLRGHIENVGDQVAGSQFWPAPDWSIVPGRLALYVYSRATDRIDHILFGLDYPLEITASRDSSVDSPPAELSPSSVDSPPAGDGVGDPSTLLDTLGDPSEWGQQPGAHPPLSALAAYLAQKERGA